MYQPYLEYPSSDPYHYNSYIGNRKLIKIPESQKLPPYSKTNKILVSKSNFRQITPASSIAIEIPEKIDDTGFIQQFCQDTTVHGLGFAANTRVTKCERILWALIFIVTSISLAVTMTFFFMNDKSVLTTVIQNASFSIANIPFPSITVCRSSNVNWDKINIAENLFLPKNSTAEMRHTFTTFLKTYHDIGFSHITLRGSQKPINMKAEQLKIIDFLNVKEVFNFLSWKCEEIFEKCTWHGNNVSCCDYFVQKYTKNGICFSFNSINNPGNLNHENEEEKHLLYSTVKDLGGALYIVLKAQMPERNRPEPSLASNMITYKKNSTVSKNKEISTVGTPDEGPPSNGASNNGRPPRGGTSDTDLPSRALNSGSRSEGGSSGTGSPRETSNNGSPPGAGPLNANPSQDGNFPSGSKPQNLPPLNFKPDPMDADTHTEIGVSIAVHDAHESPESDFFVNYASVVQISMEPSFHSNKKETEIIQSSVRQCLFEFENKDPLYSTLPHYSYNLANCNRECIRKHIFKLCNCVPDIFYPLGKFSACKPTNFPCLLENSKYFTNIVKFATEKKNDTLVCYCMSACDRINFGVTRTVDKGPPPEILSVDERSAKITIFYNVDTFIKYETSLSKNWLDYLVYYGGIASFFLGCSLLSFIEVIYYFTIRLLIYICFKKQR